MASKEILNTNVQKPATGLFTDHAPVDQPNGTLSHALNAVRKRNSLYNEAGNEICGELPQGYIPIGGRYTNDGRNILLLVSLNGQQSEIGIIDKNCEYTTIVNSRALNFKLHKQISCTYRSRRGCEDVIYFVDGDNVRYFNFSKPEDFYSETYKNFLKAGAGTFGGEKWDANKFNLFPAYTVPCFTKMQVVTGGNIPSGTFNFAIQLVDSNLNGTNFIYASQPVSIYKSTNTEYNEIYGSSNVEYDELSGSLATNKSIKLELSGLDTRYKYYRVAVMMATSGTGKVNKTILSPLISINRFEFTFDGNLQGYEEIPVEQVALPKTDISGAEFVEQIENKLILSNTKGKQVAYCEFQQFASKISSNYLIKEVASGDEEDAGNPKSPNTYWEKESYMGDEVYAYGIVYVFKDGLETPVFHIPGRAASPADLDIIPVWSEDLAPWYPEANKYNALPTHAKLKKYQVYDTSIKQSAGNISESYGLMSYHENEGVFYEPKDSCTSGDYWGVDSSGVPLEGKPIRHHKFPSRNREPHIRNGNLFEGNTGLFLDLSLIPGKAFPSTSVNVIVDYELDGVPSQVTLDILEEDLPMSSILIDEIADDFNSVNIISVAGTVDSTVFNYNVYKKETATNYINTSVLRLLGIKFSGVQYPHPDIVGHYFVRGDRDDQNRTILDKGFARQLRAKQIGANKYLTFGYFNGDVNETTKNNYLFTPRFQFNKDILSGQYLKYENEFVMGNSFVTSQEEDGAGSKVKEVNSIIESRIINYAGVSVANGEHNYKVDKSVILDATSKDLKFEGSQAPLYNLSWSNKMQIVNTHAALPRPGSNMPYVSYKVNRNVHPIVDEIVYQRTHNCMFTLNSSNSVFGGDVFISRWDIANSLFRRKKKGILKSLITILLIAAATVATVATAGIAAPAIAAAIGAAAVAGIEAAIVVTALVAGAIGVTANSVQILMDEIENGDLEEMTEDREFNKATGSGFLRLSSFMAYANELTTGLYVESEVNLSLRQEQQHVCGSFFRFQQTPNEYFRSRWLYFDPETEKWTAKGFCCPETYQYNKDFSRQNQESKYFPLPITYDCCSECLESHPNRNHWSEESFQEELTDNYRVFKPNNYIDIEAEHGAITNVIKRNNNLFIQTSEAIWLLPQSQQERVTNEIVSFIGTGAFFSIPPKKVVDSEIGTAGSQHKWATINVTEGLFFVNEIEGKVYLYADGFQELSKIGNSIWFREHMQDFFARQFKVLTGVNFPNQNNPANPYGVGIHATYDGTENRILLTKRDYQLLPTHIPNFKVVSSVNNVMPSDLVLGQLVFDMTAHKFVVASASPTTYLFVDFDNELYFENKSWTLSYSLDEKSWTSFHSYIPNYYIYNHSDFYSFIHRDNHIWKHNAKGLYQSFYGTAFPHIVEYVAKTDGLQTQFWDELSFQTVAKKLDVDSGEYIEQRYVTFNRLTAYNDRQSTGELKLVNKAGGSAEDFMMEEIVSQPGEIIISKSEKDWWLNYLRDYVDDPEKPLFLRNWASIKGVYYTDKVVNISNINYFKDWNELESLRDKYLVVRLKFDNFTDVELVTNYLLDTNGISFR